MQFVIETVTTPVQEAVAAAVRRQVFEEEFRMQAPALEPSGEPPMLMIRCHIEGRSKSLRL